MSTRTLTRSRSARKERGFTLLEAIVAMVLISTVALAAYAWINGNLLALNRIHEVNARSEATVNVLEYMRVVNPMLTPDGMAELGDYRIEWEARPVTSVVDKPTSYYLFALYRTRVSVAQSSGQPWFELNLAMVGYRKVRSPEESG